MAAVGGYQYKDGSKYLGEFDSVGNKQGLGKLCFPDATRYYGNFQKNYCSGLGVMVFPDGAKYEGEFTDGWFHGYGVFWRADGMKYEGQFRGGRVFGLGQLTFSDGSKGFPRHEGYFKDCRLTKRQPCPDIVKQAQKTAMQARVLFADKRSNY